MKGQSDTPSGSSYWVPMVGHAFRALEAFYDADGDMTLKEVSERARVSKTSALRILRTLTTLGYICRDHETGKYQLGPKIMEAARKALCSPDLIQAARPYLRRLHDLFNETVNLAVYRNSEVIYVDIVESTHFFRTASQVGERAPLHASALGKAIGAFLSPGALQTALSQGSLSPLTGRTITSQQQLIKEFLRVRKRGYAVDNEEVEEGASCVAAPILNNETQAVAAVSVAGPTARIRARQRSIARHLERAASSISNLLNSHGLR